MIYKEQAIGNVGCKFHNNVKTMESDQFMLESNFSIVRPYMMHIT